MGIVNTRVVWCRHDCLLRVVVILGGVSGAMVVTTQAGAKGFFSREVLVRAGVVFDGWMFRYFPIGMVAKVVVVIGARDRDKSELESLGKPMGWSRDSSKDFVIVCRGKSKISFGMMGGASSDHTATFSCLDRVIIVNGV